MLTVKDTLQEELRAKDLPLEITRECATLRDGRTGVDMVEDQVDEALATEDATLQEVQQLLQGKIDECTEQIRYTCCVQYIRSTQRRLLRSCHAQLEDDLTDKFNALEIDQQCAELEETSRNVNFFNDSVKIDSRYVPLVVFCTVVLTLPQGSTPGRLGRLYQ